MQIKIKEKGNNLFNMRLYIAGSHTNVGKTHASAALCYHFSYCYFKLIQAGMPTDSEYIKSLSPQTEVLKEGYCLKTAVSPHIAQKIENAHYKGQDIKLPNNENMLVEIAGGLLSPLDNNMCMIDYMSSFKLPAILVSTYYLGAINHVLLSIAALRQNDIPLLCVLFNGEPQYEIDDFIYRYSNVDIVHLPFFNAHTLKSHTQAFKQKMQKVFKEWHETHG